MKRLALTLLMLAAYAQAQLWSGVLAPARATSEWANAGATIVIRSTPCATQPSLATGIGNAGVNATSLQAAITAAFASPNCVINIPTGTYYFNTTMNIIATGNTTGLGNFTIRGAGPNSTFLIFTALGAGAAAFYESNADTNYSGSPRNVAPWTTSYSSGITSLTLGAVTSGTITTLHTGSLIILDQVDPVFSTLPLTDVQIAQATGVTPYTSVGNVYATEGGSGIGRPGLGACTWQGAWNSGQTYLATQADTVSSGGNFYQAKATSLNHVPPNATFWNPVISECRAQMQMTTVVSCTGANLASCDTTGTAPYTVVITPSLIAPNWASGNTPGAWWSNGMPLTGVGIEELSIDCGSNSGKAEIYKQNVTQSRVKHVRGISTAMYAHVWLYQTTRNTVRDSYFYGSQGASNSYGIDTSYGASNDLIENNIFQHIATATIAEGASGSVFGYNYSVDNFYTPAGNWQQGDIYSHGPNYLNLWEGHEGIELELDDIHTSNFMESIFRIYESGFDPGGGNVKTAQTSPVQLYAWSRYHNLVGNVLGGTGHTWTTYSHEASGGSDCGSITTGNVSIFNVGYSGPGGTQYAPLGTCGSGYGANFTINNDTNVSTSIMRWGNYDTKTAANRFCTANATPIAACTADERGDGAATYPGLASPNTTLPASFYLSSKPPFWNVPAPWPAVGPDIAGGNISGVGGHASHNPAANCYLNVMGGLTNGTSGPLAFPCNYTVDVPGSIFATGTITTANTVQQ